MKTKTWAIVVVLLSTITSTAAQVLYKFGADNLSLNLLSIITNLPLILGLLFYLISGVLLIFALKAGELSILYPLIALTYVWVSILSPIFFEDSMNPLKWLGIFFILLGITAMGVGSKR